jgi:hypothetical protein
MLDVSSEKHTYFSFIFCYENVVGDEVGDLQQV